MTNLSRQQVLDALTQQLPAQFEEILYQFAMPPALVRRNATQVEQAIDLICYAENQNRLAELITLLKTNASTHSSHATFNQANQRVGQQLNVTGDVHIHGDLVGGNKIVQTVTGNGNVFSATGEVQAAHDLHPKQKK